MRCAPRRPPSERRAQMLQYVRAERFRKVSPSPLRRVQMSHERGDNSRRKGGPWGGTTVRQLLYLLTLLRVGLFVYRLYLTSFCCTSLRHRQKGSL